MNYGIDLRIPYFRNLVPGTILVLVDLLRTVATINKYYLYYLGTGT